MPLSGPPRTLTLLFEPPVERHLQEAIRLSEEKYCSVGAMVKHTARIQTAYEIVEEGAEVPEAAPVAA